MNAKPFSSKTLFMAHLGHLCMVDEERKFHAAESTQDQRFHAELATALSRAVSTNLEYKLQNPQAKA